MTLAVGDKLQVSETVEFIVQIEVSYKARLSHVPWMFKRFKSRADAEALAVNLRGLGIPTSVRHRLTTTVDIVVSV